MAKKNPFLGIPWWVWLIGGGVAVVYIVGRSASNLTSQVLSTTQTMQAQQQQALQALQAQAQQSGSGLMY